MCDREYALFVNSYPARWVFCCIYYYGTAQFKLYACVLACLTQAKLQDCHVHLLHAIMIHAHGLVNTHNTQEMLAFGLPQYTCTVAVGNKMQPFCYWLASLYVCCNEHLLKARLKRYGLAKCARVSLCR